LIGDLDSENQSAQSGICRGYSVTGSYSFLLHFSFLLFLLQRERRGSRIPHSLQAVRQLLLVITEFLFFRFKGPKRPLFVVFLLLSVIVGQPD